MNVRRKPIPISAVQVISGCVIAEEPLLLGTCRQESACVFGKNVTSGIACCDLSLSLLRTPTATLAVPAFRNEAAMA